MHHISGNDLTMDQLNNFPRQMTHQEKIHQNEPRDCRKSQGHFYSTQKQLI